MDTGLGFFRDLELTNQIEILIGLLLAVALGMENDGRLASGLLAAFAVSVFADLLVAAGDNYREAACRTLVFEVANVGLADIVPTRKHERGRFLAELYGTDRA